RARAQAEIGALRVRHHEAQSKADVLIGTGRTPSDLDRAWDAALADAVKGIQAARAEADAQARARAARAGEAEGMTWQAMAE
ncbi:hypothetical protein NL393_37805, partial [Klebsiella pneumoniae]|nr:hypothetical protein [Klebsiella pneumoniae]